MSKPSHATKSSASVALDSPTATKEAPQAVDATPTEPTSAKTEIVKQTVNASASLVAKPHDDFDVTIIWHNLYAESDFMTFRKESQGPIARILVDFARVLELGLFEDVVSVNASKYLFCVTVICEKNREDGVMDAILSVH